MTQRLEVDTRELVRALKDLRIGLKKNTSQRASLTCADGMLAYVLASRTGDGNETYRS